MDEGDVEGNGGRDEGANVGVLDLQAAGIKGQYLIFIFFNCQFWFAAFTSEGKDQVILISDFELLK